MALPPVAHTAPILGGCAVPVLRMSPWLAERRLFSGGLDTHRFAILDLRRRMFCTPNGCLRTARRC
jgi:hypothetical protein